MDSWTWAEAVNFIPKVMEYTSNDALLLRWFLNYEEVFPSFDEFKAALGADSPVSRQTVEEIEADAAGLMELDWEVSDGKRH